MFTALLKEQGDAASMAVTASPEVGLVIFFLVLLTCLSRSSFGVFVGLHFLAILEASRPPYKNVGPLPAGYPTLGHHLLLYGFENLFCI